MADPSLPSDRDDDAADVTDFQETQPRRVTLLQRVEYALIRGAIGVVGRLPERLAYGFVGFVGELYFRCSKKRQRFALRLLRNAYPDVADEHELLRLGRTGTGNLFRVVLDMLLVGGWIARGHFDDRVDTGELVERMPRAPFVGVTGHLGSWEVGAIAVARHNEETHAVVRLMKNPLAQEFIADSRRRAGLCLHSRRGGIRPLARALERGCVALQVVDQNQRLRGVFVPFFGEPASTERAAATLAVRKGYPVWVAGCVRTGPGAFRFIVQETLRAEDSGDVQADVERLTARINRALEQMILRFPEQYLWIHDRYRTQPPSAAAAEQAAPDVERDARERSQSAAGS